MQILINSLKEFKLAGMAFTLEERLNYARSNKIGYEDLLGLLCEDERDNNYKRRKHGQIAINEEIRGF